MLILRLIRTLAVVCIGLLAGIYVADRATAPARATLSASSFVQYQQTVHITYVKMMPPLVIAAIIAAIGWLILVRSQWREAEFWIIASAACAVIFIAVLTRAVNIPLNEQLMTWSITDPPANLKDLWAPWERVDAIRTAAAVCAFLLETIALCFKAPGSAQINVKPGVA
jgi:uncharacterized membrane protein